MKTHVIAMAGLAGTGKDTAADLLVAHFRFRKLAFADALRSEVAEAFSVDMEYMLDPERKNKPAAAFSMQRAPLGFLGAVALSVGNEARTPSGYISQEWLDAPRAPRRILQWWGTEYRRRQHPQYWSSILCSRIASYRRNGETRFAITDCRFDNEAAAIRQMGGKIWQLKRPGIDLAAEGAHVSVNDGSQFEPDAIISNIHDVRHLQQLVLSEFVGYETGLESVKVSVA